MATVEAEPLKACIYTRVSTDKAEGRSPVEQEQEARDVCARNGWNVVEVVTDSVGASRHSKGQRSGWVKAKDRIASGQIDVLVTWEASRAGRDLAAYVELRDLCAQHGVLWSYSGKTNDLDSTDGRFNTGLDALLAEREASQIADRVKRAIRANAAAGTPHGRLLFGYTRVYDETTGRPLRQEPHPEQAPVVVSIFSDYLSGLGIRTIARRLNGQGITTSTGAQWNDAQVRRVLVNPAYAGRRVHQGQVVGDATWAPLVTPEQFDRVQARLIAKRTSQTRQRPTARLLSGVARCGVCGGKVQRGHDRNRRDVYICKVGFHVARDMRKLDAHVTVELLRDLARFVGDDRPEEAEDAVVTSARQRAAELQAKLDDAVEQFTSGRLTATTLGKVESRLLPLIEAAEQEARRSLVPLDIAIPANHLEEWWDALTPEIQREVVAWRIAAVVVRPTKKGSRNFDPDSVEVEFRRSRTGH